MLKIYYFSYKMLRISRGRETLTIKGDHLETNFKGFDQKSLHWRPRSPMETSVTIPVDNFFPLVLLETALFIGHRVLADEE